MPASPGSIGYIGLGIMGAPAARNLLKAGYKVGVWARRAEALLPLVNDGATAFDSAAALAAKCDIVITNLSDTPDVEEVVLGSLKDSLPAGSLVIDMSTIAPTAARKIANELKTKDIDFLDAPVSGGEKGAIEGALTFMVGGDAAAFERAQPVFNAMGKVITHIGEHGCGQVAKACNQIIIGATLSGVAEAFALATANGTDLNKVRAALLGGFANSKVLEFHAMRMIENNYAPGFKAKLHHKDINIALAEAAAANLDLPAADLFGQQLTQLINNGDGELDSAAIAKVV